MYYNFIVDFDENGCPIIVSDVFGEIPIPNHMVDAFCETNKEFAQMLFEANRSLDSGDLRMASEIADKMEARWGSMEENTRLLRWMILENSVDNEDD